MIALAIIGTLAAMGWHLFVVFANAMRSSPGEYAGRGSIKLAWLLVAILWVGGIAFAHDHSRPELDDWMKGLHANGGAWCCDGKDTDPIDDWEMKGDHYRVRYQGKWFDVPKEAVVDGPNKAGGALLWMSKGYGEVSVRCFMPGALI